MAQETKQPQPQKSSRLKWILGCCGGCAGVVLIVAIVLGLLLHSMLRARPVLPAEAFLSPDADVLLVAQLNPTDVAVGTLVMDLAQNPPASIPMDPRQKARLRAESMKVGQTAVQMAPIHLVIVGLPQVKEGKLKSGGVVSVRAHSGLIRWFFNAGVNGMRDQGGSVAKYKSAAIGTSKDGTSLAAVTNNFMMASDPQIIEKWIDRIRELEKSKDPEHLNLPYSGPEGLKDLYEALDPTAHVRFVLLNAHGEVGALMEWAKNQKQLGESAVQALSAAPMDWSNVKAAGGTLKILDPDTVGCEIHIQCADKAFARGLKGEIESALDAGVKSGEIKDLQVNQEGAVLTVLFNLTGIQDALRKAAAAGVPKPPMPAEAPPTVPR